jgi:hypothetical protein
MKTTKAQRTFQLHRETLRTLDTGDLRHIAAGLSATNCTGCDTFHCATTHCTTCG